MKKQVYYVAKWDLGKTPKYSHLKYDFFSAKKRDVIAQLEALYECTWAQINKYYANISIVKVVITEVQK